MNQARHRETVMTQHQAHWEVADRGSRTRSRNKKYKTRTCCLTQLFELAGYERLMIDNGTTDIRTREGQDTITCRNQQSQRVLKVDF